MDDAEAVAAAVAILLLVVVLLALVTDGTVGSLRASMGHSPVAVTVVQRHGLAYVLALLVLLLLPLLCWALAFVEAAAELPPLLLLLLLNGPLDIEHIEKIERTH